jgi:hypothetical protein
MNGISSSTTGSRKFPLLLNGVDASIDFNNEFYNIGKQSEEVAQYSSVVS